MLWGFMWRPSYHLNANIAEPILNNKLLGGWMKYARDLVSKTGIYTCLFRHRSRTRYIKTYKVEQKKFNCSFSFSKKFSSEITIVDYEYCINLWAVNIRLYLFLGVNHTLCLQYISAISRPQSRKRGRAAEVIVHLRSYSLDYDNLEKNQGRLKRLLQVNRRLFSCDLCL